MQITDYKQYFDLEKLIKKILTYLPGFDVKRFKEAFSFAEEAHRGQLRKDGKTPYIAHPVAALSILISLHADEDTLISALLHDVPEDTSRSIEDVKDKFGPKVAFLVDGITKLSKVQYQHNMPERDIKSLKKFLIHSAKDVRVIIIKLADRLHNMQTLDNITDPKKRLRIATETMEIYVPIADLLGIRELKSKLADLSFKYMFPEEYLKMQEKIEGSQTDRDKNTKKFIKTVKEISEASKIEIEIEPKSKNFFSIYKTISALGKTIDYLDDRIGIKVTVDDLQDCYRILGLIHQKFSPLTKKFRDYIANPKPNGYRSLHTSVFGIDGRLTEIQIRTREMDIEAEYGIAINFFDQKNSTENDFSLDLKKFSWLKEAIQIGSAKDEGENFIDDLKYDILQERIVAMTPKGLKVDLPKGANVLDFAYAIHSDLGDHAVKADINGQIVSITTTLNQRDIVRVVTDEKASPELSWLSFVKTNTAKKKILARLKMETKQHKKAQAMRLLQKEMDIADLGLVQNINFKKLRCYLFDSQNRDFKTLDEVLVQIGGGELKISETIAGIKGEKNETNLKSYTVNLTLKIIAHNRFGLAKDIYEVLYRYADDMSVFKGWTSKHAKQACFVVEILIKDEKMIGKIFNELERIDGVAKVLKVSKKGVRLATAAGVTLGLAWVLHPLFLMELINSAFNQKYPLFFGGLIYFSLFFVFGLFLYALHILNKFFPLVRHKKIIWILVFLVPILATGTLAIEIFYFNVNLSWLFVFLEVLFIYAYLGVNYSRFLKSTRKI